MPPEMVVQAETRFSESPFVQECLEWHNNYRRKHLAPDLTLDPPVSTFILGYIKGTQNSILPTKSTVERHLSQDF